MFPDVPLAKAYPYRERPIPLPAIDPYSIDPVLLGSYGPPSSSSTDEDGNGSSTSAIFVPFVVDLDGLARPVEEEFIMIFKPVEHVMIPALFRIRSTSLRLFGFDPAPTVFDGYMSLGVLACLVIIGLEVALKRHMDELERRGEYWRRPPWLAWWGRFITALIPEQEEYIL